MSLPHCSSCLTSLAAINLVRRGQARWSNYEAGSPGFRTAEWIVVVDLPVGGERGGLAREVPSALITPLSSIRPLSRNSAMPLFQRPLRGC